MPLRLRYLVPFFSFAAIMTVYMWSLIAAKQPGLKDSRKEFATILVFTLFLLIVPTYKIDYFRSKFDAFIWKSDPEYTEFSDMFANGELLLTSHRGMAYSMIARFKKPVRIRKREEGLSSFELSPAHLCVKQLSKSPLSLNYEDCAD